MTYEIACDKGNKARPFPLAKSFLTYIASQDGQAQLAAAGLRPAAERDRHQGPHHHLLPFLTEAGGPAASRPRDPPRIRCTAAGGAPSPTQTGESPMTTTAPPPLPAPPRAGDKTVTRPGDRIFAGLARGSGIALLVVMAAIAVFLTVRAVQRDLQGPRQLPDHLRVERRA